MANYRFEDINNGIALTNPTISIAHIIDNRDGTAVVRISITGGNPAPHFEMSFVVAMDTLFTYSGDQPMKADVDAWFAIEILTYIVP